jgi:hypothetical protein
MQIDLVRTDFVPNIVKKERATIGDFIINGKWYSYSLEDEDRQWNGKDGTIIPWSSSIKIPKLTAIPYGTYEIIINYSPSFGCEMPLLLNVPNYMGVRIHNGSYPEDSEGCSCIGFNRQEGGMIYNSKSAFRSFMPILRAALKIEKVWITISNWFNYKGKG